MTFHYTGWLIGILIVAYEKHLYITGLYISPLYKLNSQDFGYCSSDCDTDTHGHSSIPGWYPNSWEDTLFSWLVNLPPSLTYPPQK